jgi:hypothetical protein
MGHICSHRGDHADCMDGPSLVPGEILKWVHALGSTPSFTALQWHDFWQKILCHLSSAMRFSLGHINLGLLNSHLPFLYKRSQIKFWVALQGALTLWTTVSVWNTLKFNLESNWFSGFSLSHKSYIAVILNFKCSNHIIYFACEAM